MNLSCRGYHTGDEGELIALWNRAHARYGGFVVRSVESWRWNILSRPGISAADIVILEWRGQICAYAVLAPHAVVLEFALTTEFHRWRRRRVFVHLLHVLEERARRRGDELLSFAAPASEPFIDKVLKDAGYVVEQAEYLSLGILNAAELVQRLLTHHAHRLPARWCKNFALQISPGRYRIVRHSQLRIAIAGRLVTVQDKCADPQSSDCLVSMDLETLTAIIFGRSTIEQAIDAGRARLRDATSQSDVSRLFSALAIATPWYTPLADIY